MRSKLFPLLLTLAMSFMTASAAAVETIEEYDSKIPVWGASWLPVKALSGNVYLSFYTGFAPRVESPERIHVQSSRGNQARITLILDDATIHDYLFDLVARRDFYRQMLDEKWIDISMERKEKRAVEPQVEYFMDIVDSPAYQISGTVAAAQKSSDSGGEIDKKALYKKSLHVLTQLNPHRVFPLKFDLKAEFSAWREQAAAFIKANSGDQKPSREQIAKQLRSNRNETLILANNLLFGRINAIEVNKEAGDKLVDVLASIVDGEDYSSEALLMETVQLFKALTGGKYEFQVLSQSGEFKPALACDSAAECSLEYHEFTTISPFGSIKSAARDRHNNVINSFATPGLWQFLSRGYHDVDNIRSEFYYGMVPKMDYEAAGNGFHNPAVRFSGLSGSLKKTLEIPTHHTNFWTVKRGRVSHGCNRMAAGQVWELRNIFPVENKKATQILYFGNSPRDFDLFDIDGDGKREIMGVTYYIVYTAKGASWSSKREGTNLEVEMRGSEKFYKKLLGEKNVFTYSKDGITIHDPEISYFSKADFKKKKTISKIIKGDFPLYEQLYARDKIQFYRPLKISTRGGFMIMKEGQKTMSNRNPSKQFVRLFGRVRGCAPFSDKDACGENAFIKEKTSLLTQLARHK